MSVTVIPDTEIKTFLSIEECRQFRKDNSGKKIVLVPTMGALHEGHFSLIRHAHTVADLVVVSIFVNPTQFGPNEDFDRYPRTFEADFDACEKLGVDAVFHPSVDVMYPDGQEALTTVVPPVHLTGQFCAVNRPGHFEAVASVVSKLFNIVEPNIAIFGEKDAQQLAVIRQMVNDLNKQVEIMGSPTARDENGLALSSRNKYLKTDDEKQLALCLSQILNEVIHRSKQMLQNGQAESIFTDVFEAAKTTVLNPLGGLADKFELEYLAAVDKHTFKPLEKVNSHAKILIAAKVGNVRLIDNMDITESIL